MKPDIIRMENFAFFWYHLFESGTELERKISLRVE